MRTPAVWAAALALTLAACSPTPSAPKRVAVVHDLVTELPAAELHREVGTIDFGTAEARVALGEGWYQNEGGGQRGPTIVWSKGRRSILNFWLAAPRALEAEVRCAPYDPQDGQPQVVTIELNGHRVGELSLRSKLNDYAIELPRESQVAGENRLDFRYRRVTRFGHRHLGVSWDLLRFTPGPPASAELPRAATRPGSPTHALFLPFGTEAGYYFALEDGGTLSVQGVRGQGPAGGTLQLVAQEEGSPEKILDSLKAGSGPRSLELPGRGARLVHLALRAVPERQAATGGFLLLGPGVRGIATAPAAESTGTKDASPRPNVIIYLVDTLRADRVGPYRSGASITPNIDAFAESATVFENTVAQAPWTKPSVTSILTGLNPLVHGVRLLDDKLPPEAVTAAELLHAAGFQTAGFSTNWHVRHETGLDQGFGFFDFAPDEAASNLLNQRVFRWLDHLAKPPFFLYVHALDPHAPYTPPPEYREKFAPDVRPEAGYDFDMKQIWALRGKERRRRMAEVIPLYDAEVAFNDHSFGDFLAALRQHGMFEKSLIVFVADHGEEFDEHGDFGHANNLYNETLNIPLIVKWPGQRRGQRVSAVAQHIDLLPTLLRTAGLAVPKGLRGMDLSVVAASGEDPDSLAGRWVISHLSHRGREGISVVHAGWKLIHPLTRELAESSMLFHRSIDRTERNNRLGEFPVHAGWLESLIRFERDRSRSGLKAQSFEMDEETRKALEALGYL
ncbi:MAG TPA: sulfatase [Thermoanaerobaculia bacterium]|nr:sulfatase [Thermoanaerobaculia bacterium]